MYLQQKYSPKKYTKSIDKSQGWGRGLGLKIKYWIDYVVTVITLYNISYTTLLIQNAFIITNMLLGQHNNIRFIN